MRKLDSFKEEVLWAKRYLMVVALVCLLAFAFFSPRGEVIGAIVTYVSVLFSILMLMLVGLFERLYELEECVCDE